MTAEELSLPRVKYFLYYPLALGASALMLWIFPTDSMTAFCCAIATVIASIMMWEFLFNVQAIRFSTILSMGLAIGYGTGTLNSWQNMPRDGLTLASVVGQSVPELANGIAAAVMSCAVIMLVGELVEKPIWTTDRQLPITGGVKRILYINTVILFLAAATGKVMQGGVKTAGPDRAGVLAVFILFLLAPTAVIATVVFLKEESKGSKYILGCIALFLWLLLATQGRRALIYTPLVTIAIARLSGYRWGRITWSRVVFVCVGLAFVVLGGLTYQLFRIAGGTVRSNKLGAEMKQAQQWVSQGEAWKIATTSSVSNLERRTLVATFLSSLLYRETTQAPAYGRDLLLQFELTVPSAIYPNKPTISEEQLASQTLHVFYTDQPNSIFTAGALDFGLTGVFLYPIIMMLAYSGILRLGYRYLSYEVFLFILVVIMLLAMKTEMQLEEYFEVVRDLIIFSSFIFAASKLPGFGLSRVDGGGVPIEEQ